ncbi:MAG: thiamine phosphate synthase [Acidaminococcus sp.]|jgi:thiamine-phosphate pyrophosphorylase|nr:thiamine phosphate synthase [Acidaminococcus sp.]MCI2100885.1 thiamine phosphate synthase [Acidaminococcus sp.]MCI2117314.1 thiamine phosphate synthase [Acidaminococcus sp.]
MAAFSYVLLTDRKLYSEPVPKVISRALTQLHPMPGAVIVREKDLPETAYEKLLAEVMAVCAPYGVPVLAHAFPDSYVRLHAAGVHMPLFLWRAYSKVHPQLKMLLSESGRKAAEHPCGLGISIHSEAEALEALHLGASYVTASPIFPTSCKPGATGKGTAFIARIHELTGLPVYALGGLQWPDERETQFKLCGAAGAVVRSFVTKLI